jgi:diaminohydroxyphosphoribosylaminopyrimidine deaminase/5-amino-6-(5-phosphoribosylamino)uracil reductase
MRAALSLARRGLGTAWPNPAVGCIIVRDGAVVGRGWTRPGGRPHAEAEALRRAGRKARGACAYVTLEPCNHHGVTPPCAQAMLDAGITRLVGACEDPDPRTAGNGYARLRQAGVEVVTGMLRAEAQILNAGFLRRVRDGRPLITLKTATTLDGRIAAQGGRSQWITGPQARARGHLLRASHDAIMIGIGTALADAPALTCRIAGLESRSPVRIIVDTNLRLPLDCVLAATARETPTWVMTVADEAKCRTLRARGVDVIQIVRDGDGRPDLGAVMQALGARGITRLLVEGGGTLAGALLRADLIDRLAWFRASSVMGGDGLPTVAGYGVRDPDQMARFTRTARIALGCDSLEEFERIRVSPCSPD